MSRIWGWLRYYLCRAPKWHAATKASCWFGSNAATRIMNILSPKFTESQFKARVKLAEARGVNTFHLFLANTSDGAGSGYRADDAETAKVMDRRIRCIRKRGHAVVLWIVSDDSASWAREAGFVEAICKAAKRHGWFKQASTVVAGLEMNEYWESSQARAAVETIRRYYGGKVGVHMTSGRRDYAAFADILFYQVNPGLAADRIRSETRAALASGKPVNFFELDRHENRHLCQAALDAGAFGVGNW